MKKRFYINGMHCENCAKGLKSILEEDLSGISVLEVNYNENYVDVDVEGSVDFNDIADAVSELDFSLVKIVGD